MTDTDKAMPDELYVRYKYMGKMQHSSVDDGGCVRYVRDDLAIAAVYSEINAIAAEYRRQQMNGFVDTPGGIEHVGDAFRLILKWDSILSKGAK